MIIVGDNSNTVGSLTISSSTDWYRYCPTTDGGSPVSNAITEKYVNIILPYQIDKVIFNDPATIVIWKDKTKTVVKRHNEPYDREKGLAMCIAKKVLVKDFHKTFREWCERSDA